MEPEPKTFLLIWRDGEYFVSEPNIDSCEVARTDDPTIVQALAVRKACHEAGLLDEHGNLRRIIGTLPVTADGVIVGENADVSLYGLPLIGNANDAPILSYGELSSRRVWIRFSRNVADLRYEDARYEDEEIPVEQCFFTREAAERAACEPGNGGPDGQ